MKSSNHHYAKSAFKRFFFKSLIMVLFIGFEQIHAQTITYKIIEQNPDYYFSRYHFWMTLPEFGSVNLIGISAGIWSDIDIPKTPLVFQPRVNFELAGAQEERWRIMKNPDVKRAREYDFMLKCKVLGKERPAKLKLILSSEYSGYNTTTTKYLSGVEGKRRTHIMLRAGVYRWGYDDFRATGFIYGIGIRDKRQVTIKPDFDPKYNYSADHNTELYFDRFWLPFNNALPTEPIQPRNSGWRVGIQRGDDTRTYFFEISVRPGPYENGAHFYLTQGITFGKGY